MKPLRGLLDKLILWDLRQGVQGLDNRIAILKRKYEKCDPWMHKTKAGLIDDIGELNREKQKMLKQIERIENEKSNS